MTNTLPQTLARAVQILRSSAADEVATARALTQLRLESPPESQLLLLKAGVPRLLLGALEAHSRSEAVAVSALRAMPSVCIHVKTNSPLRSPDVFVSLARAALVAMRAHPQSPPVQRAGCEALAHIARTGQAVCDACVAEGAVECVAGALSLSQKLGPLELPVAACEALKALRSSSHSARERMVALGAVGTLVRMVGGGDQDSQVTLSTCEVLRTLSGSGGLSVLAAMASAEAPRSLVRFIPQEAQALRPVQLCLFSAAAATLSCLAQRSQEMLDSVRVARENEAAREEIARLKAGLEACKDAPERLAELQHAYDLLLHAYYEC
eukprot:m51a1_g14596 hypothetical protein (324) ;mRNA; r:1168155-1169669